MFLNSWWIAQQGDSQSHLTLFYKDQYIGLITSSEYDLVPGKPYHDWIYLKTVELEYPGKLVATPAGAVSVNGVPLPVQAVCQTVPYNPLIFTLGSFGSPSFYARGAPKVGLTLPPRTLVQVLIPEQEDFL